MQGDAGRCREMQGDAGRDRVRGRDPDAAPSHISPYLPGRRPEPQPRGHRDLPTSRYISLHLPTSRCISQARVAQSLNLVEDSAGGEQALAL